MARLWRNWFRDFGTLAADSRRIYGRTVANFGAGLVLPWFSGHFAARFDLPTASSYLISDPEKATFNPLSLIDLGFIDLATSSDRWPPDLSDILSTSSPSRTFLFIGKNLRPGNQKHEDRILLLAGISALFMWMFSTFQKADKISFGIDASAAWWAERTQSPFRWPLTWLRADEIGVPWNGQWGSRNVGSRQRDGHHRLQMIRPSPPGCGATANAPQAAGIRKLPNWHFPTDWGGSTRLRWAAASIIHSYVSVTHRCIHLSLCVQGARHQMALALELSFCLLVHT